METLAAFLAIGAFMILYVLLDGAANSGFQNPDKAAVLAVVCLCGGVFFGAVALGISISGIIADALDVTNGGQSFTMETLI